MNNEKRIISLNELIQYIEPNIMRIKSEITELESYSNVVGTFRAQGTLNAVKLRILKDLREAFHISDARHKAEVRRVVNDESLSTIAKM